MINLVFTKTFLKQLKKLDKSFVSVVVEKIESFKNPDNHKRLEVHKLHGRLAQKYAFSINRKDRIIFIYQSDNEAIILTIDDHNFYRKK